MSSAHQRRKAFSQNFLHNPQLVASLVARSSLGPDDTVLEIGPGHGAITAELVRRCRHVLAVERDPACVERLKSRFGASAHLTLFTEDFLAFPLPQSRYKVFASIPYRITAATVGKLTSGIAPPEDMYLVVQREAAERYMGQPATTLVSARLFPWYQTSIHHQFHRADFRPVPAVDSVLFRLEQRSQPLIPASHRDHYVDFVAAVFTAWKPTARKAAASVLPRRAFHALDAALGTELAHRPSQVPSGTWVRAFLVLAALNDPTIWKGVTGAQAALDKREETLTRRTRSSAATSRRRQ